jgi:hypothetical protein
LIGRATFHNVPFREIAGVRSRPDEVNRSERLRALVRRFQRGVEREVERAARAKLRPPKG